jgi:hypothetical protein
MEDLQSAMEREFAKISDPASTDSIAQAIRPLLRKAFEAGAAFTLDRVIAAQQSTAEALTRAVRGKMPASDLFNSTARTIIAPTPAVVVKRARKPPATRAAKGRIAEILHVVLAEKPGSTTSEAERLGLMLDPLIAIKSVGNELRRNRGITYRKEGTGWFLISDEGNEAAGNALPAPAASISLTDGGANATTIAA